MLNTATPNNVITDVDFNLSAYIDQTTGFLYLKDSYGNIAPASDYLPSSGSGGNTVTIQKQLSGEDIIALNNSEYIDIIPAPASGTYVEFISGFMAYDSGSTPFDAQVQFLINWGETTDDSIQCNDLNIASSKNSGMAFLDTFGASMKDGVALTLRTDDTITGGDGTITAIITYKLVTL